MNIHSVGHERKRTTTGVDVFLENTSGKTLDKLFTEPLEGGVFALEAPVGLFLSTFAGTKL
ncbi:hypothetical protein ZHAS_00015672 [Anopheles sinensis]|uniref:Uncharacterized protein n=1 Tax=Anopheles sinensis TaxID=74873 RepID=A0A084WBN7_ANOSI|nr:hypothetical protein ZHAS_00015672 [Anopheles sinensis]